MVKTQIATLQFITQDHPTLSHVEQIKQAMEGGVRWVQLRMKDASDAAIEQEATEALKWTRRYNGILIIDDNPYIVAKVGADGVHLGKKDIAPNEARKIIGSDKIIGGTANTFNDINFLRLQEVDYIGLGPFLYTTTKKHLSPLLGLEGYQTILQQLKKEGIMAPIVAIGGIKENDLVHLFATGLHGVAISGTIAMSENITKTAQEFVNQVNKLAKEV